MSNAFLHTPLPAKDIVYVNPPKEWINEDYETRKDQLWQVHMVLVGMREGPMLWLDHFGGRLVHYGLLRCPTNPNYFVGKGIFMEVHMDDVHGAGEKKCLKDLASFLEKEFDLKWQIHDADDADYEHLRRRRVRDAYGMKIHAGAHRIEHLAQLFGFDDTTKAKPTPLPSNTVTTFEGDLLDAGEVSTRRRGGGILLYVAGWRQARRAVSDAAAGAEAF